jgi:hypothetical protein
MKHRRWILAACLCAVFVVVTGIAVMRHCFDDYNKLLRALASTNRTVLLAECRSLIAETRTEDVSGVRRQRDSQDEIIFNAADDPIPQSIPLVVRLLRPRTIIITGDYVMVILDVPGRRVGLLAFRQGAEEFGTTKMTDGLWFWNGRFESEEMQERVHRRIR